MIEEAQTITLSTAPAKTRVYAMALLSLLAGLAIGYVSRGPRLSVTTMRPDGNSIKRTETTSTGTSTSMSPATNVGKVATIPNGQGHTLIRHMPEMAEMEQMADKQTAPLLEKLRSDPDSILLLRQIGAVYHSNHQFKEAAVYYAKAIKVNPKNVDLRNKLATSLFRSGDVDGAINQLNEALRDDPKDANSLFNLGFIRLHGKGDGRGAVAAWQKLCDSNPQLSTDRKATVQKLMAEVSATYRDQGRAEGTRGDGGRTKKTN